MIVLINNRFKKHLLFAANELGYKLYRIIHISEIDTLKKLVLTVKKRDGYDAIIIDDKLFLFKALVNEIKYFWFKHLKKNKSEQEILNRLSRRIFNINATN